MKKFADRLRGRMAELGLTQAEVARRLGIGQRRLGQYLTPRVGTGKISEPDFTMLVRICDVLDTHPNYLLGVTQEPERPSLAANSLRLTVLERELKELQDKLNKM